MTKKHIFDKENAIKLMKEESRGIITLNMASSLITPFTNCATIPITKSDEIHDEIKGMSFDLKKRITWYGPEREGIGISELTQIIVKALGEKPYTESPYLGAGRTAEHLTMNNLAIICAKLGIESDDCKEVYGWISPTNFEALKKFNPKITKEEYDKLRKVL